MLRRAIVIVLKTFINKCEIDRFCPIDCGAGRRTTYGSCLMVNGLRIE